jgi:hypothetical protein
MVHVYLLVHYVQAHYVHVLYCSWHVYLHDVLVYARTPCECFTVVYVHYVRVRHVSTLYVVLQYMFIFTLWQNTRMFYLQF